MTARFLRRDGRSIRWEASCESEKAFSIRLTGRGEADGRTYRPGRKANPSPFLFPPSSLHLARMSVARRAKRGSSFNLASASVFGFGRTQPCFARQRLSCDQSVDPPTTEPSTSAVRTRTMRSFVVARILPSRNGLLSKKLLVCDEGTRCGFACSFSNEKGKQIWKKLSI